MRRHKIRPAGPIDGIGLQHGTGIVELRWAWRLSTSTVDASTSPGDSPSGSSQHTLASQSSCANILKRMVTGETLPLAVALTTFLLVGSESSIVTATFSMSNRKSSWVTFHWTPRTLWTPYFSSTLTPSELLAYD